MDFLLAEGFDPVIQQWTLYAAIGAVGVSFVAGLLAFFAPLIVQRWQAREARVAAAAEQQAALDAIEAQHAATLKANELVHEANLRTIAAEDRARHQAWVLDQRRSAFTEYLAVKLDLVHAYEEQTRTKQWNRQGLMSFEEMESSLQTLSHAHSRVLLFADETTIDKCQEFYQLMVKHLHDIVTASKVREILEQKAYDRVLFAASNSVNDAFRRSIMLTQTTETPLS